jgi:hypothetical protein
MGGDDAIVQAARVSYGKGTKKKSDDRGLIRYLMRNWHTTPFEMVVFKFHVRVPMDCWRQWIRHRMASVNEYRVLYSVMSTALDDARRRQPGPRFANAADRSRYRRGGNWYCRRTQGGPTTANSWKAAGKPTGAPRSDLTASECVIGGFYWPMVLARRCTRSLLLDLAE